MPLEITDIIAERELTFVEANGTCHPCRLVFGKPIKLEYSYRCDFQIIGFENDRIFDAQGQDSLQAVLLAVERANIETAYHGYEGTFFFHSSNELDLVARDLRQ